MSYRTSRSPLAKRPHTDDGKRGASRNSNAAASASSQSGMASASGGGAVALPASSEINVLPLELLEQILYFVLGPFDVGEFLPLLSHDEKSTMRTLPMVGSLRLVCTSWREIVAPFVAQCSDAAKLTWKQNSPLEDATEDTTIPIGEVGGHFTFSFRRPFSSEKFTKYHALVAMEQLRAVVYRFKKKYPLPHRPRADVKLSKGMAKKIFESTIYAESIPLARFLIGYTSKFSAKGGKNLIVAMEKFMSNHPWLSVIMDATSRDASDLKLKREYTWFIVITIGSMSKIMLQQLLLGNENVLNLRSPKEFSEKESGDDEYMRMLKIYEYFENMGHLLEDQKQGPFFRQLMKTVYEVVELDSEKVKQDIEVDKALWDYQTLRCSSITPPFETVTAHLETLKNVSQWREYQTSGKEFHCREEFEKAIGWCVAELKKDKDPRKRWLEQEGVQNLFASSREIHGAAGGAAAGAGAQSYGAGAAGGAAAGAGAQPKRYGHSVAPAGFPTAHSVAPVAEEQKRTAGAVFSTALFNLRRSDQFNRRGPCCLCGEESLMIYFEEDGICELCHLKA